MENVTVYHAGTAVNEEGELVTSGGRVLDVTALGETFEAARDLEWAVSVVLTSAGYPGSYEKGKVITGIEDAAAMENVTVYHAGTAVNEEGELVTSGGRVLDVTALGETFEAARDLAYAACEKIAFEGKTLRRDIGLRALRGRDAWDA